MNESLLREVAERIAREQFLLQWPIYALMVTIALVVGFAAAYLGAYAKKRGESLATKADFEALLSQLKATTAVAEEVKASVSHADWAAREQRTLRRIKLEELLHAVHEVQAWLEIERDARIFNSGKDPGLSPIPKVEVIVGLYFPELWQAEYDFGQAHRQMAFEIIKAQSNILDAANNAVAKQAAVKQFTANYTPLYTAQLRNIAALESKAREIMAGLVGA